MAQNKFGIWRGGVGIGKDDGGGGERRPYSDIGGNQ